LANAEPIRKIFRQAFAGAGLPYFNPHSFRDTLVQLGKRLCQTPEEFEAWSKNLGHEHMLTTFRSYGAIDPHRQGELIKSLGAERQHENKIDQLIEMVQGLKRPRNCGTPRRHKTSSPSSSGISKLPVSQAATTLSPLSIWYLSGYLRGPCSV
jgi:hypothetical protein